MQVLRWIGSSRVERCGYKAPKQAQYLLAPFLFLVYPRCELPCFSVGGRGLLAPPFSYNPDILIPDILQPDFLVT